MRQVAISLGDYGGVMEVAAVEIESGQLTGKTFMARLHYEQGQFSLTNNLDGLFGFISNAELIVDWRNHCYRHVPQHGLTEDSLREHCRSIQYINDLFRPHLGHDGWAGRDYAIAIGLSRHFNLLPIRKMHGDSALSHAMILGASFLIMTSTA